MNTKARDPFVTGFMLLPVSEDATYYRGVDRDPFQPLLVDAEIDPEIAIDAERRHIWEFFPPGWKRDVYRLFEEYVVHSPYDDLFLLRDFETAEQIAQAISPRIGNHEIFQVSVFSLDALPIKLQDTVNSMFLGYDVAYPGGDYYSALKNGILFRTARSASNDEEDYYTPFYPMVNQHGLFSHTNLIPSYLQCFRSHALSETQSEFVVYRLAEARSVEPGTEKGTA
jgi:hypothetical protein